VERAAKKEAVEELRTVFKATGVAIVAHYSGLTVSQMQTLRKQMKQAGAAVKVSKNRLAKIALEGTDVAAIGPLLKGPTVIATSNDPVAAPKVAIEFAKTNERFVILGGSMGKTVLNVDGVKATSCAARLSASSRRRRPSSPSSRTRRRQSLRASFRPMPQRAKRPDALRNTQTLVRTNVLRKLING